MTKQAVNSGILGCARIAINNVIPAIQRVICKKAIQAIENGKMVFSAKKKQTFSHRK